VRVPLSARGTLARVVPLSARGTVETVGAAICPRQRCSVRQWLLDNKDGEMTLIVATVVGVLLLLLVLRFREVLSQHLRARPALFVIVALLVGALVGTASAPLRAPGSVQTLRGTVTAIPPSGDSICLTVAESTIDAALSYLGRAFEGQSCAWLSPTVDNARLKVGDRVVAGLASYTPERGSSEDVFLYVRPDE
jgi:hypothetical protein